MRSHCIFPFYIALILFSAENLFAQLKEADSNLYQSAVSNAVSLYHASLTDQSGLCNGALYTGYLFRFKEGTPFFISEQRDSGSVFYDGILYQNLPLLYNNLDDVLIADDNGYPIKLNGKKVAFFTIPGHYFIRHEKADSGVGINTGFYEVLYNGSINILKKTIKKIDEDISNGHTVDRIIRASDYYYIQKDSIIYTIENKNDITEILPSRKKEILQFIKKNKLNFRKDKENALVQIAAYYEQIRK
jgi:hypothetical protein